MKPGINVKDFKITITKSNWEGEPFKKDNLMPTSIVGAQIVRKDTIAYIELTCEFRDKYYIIAVGKMNQSKRKHLVEDAEVFLDKGYLYVVTEDGLVSFAALTVPIETDKPNETIKLEFTKTFRLLSRLKSLTDEDEGKDKPK